MAKKLEIVPTIKDGVMLALLNYLSIVLAVILYVVTIWIPYLNVGTTIAMASIPAEIAKGNVINPLFIFDGKFRRNMGEFFILMALMYGAVSVGFMFGIIPGIVISYAWYLAIILFVDKDMSALDSLRESNKLTFGNKWSIFGIEMLLAIALFVAMGIISFIFGLGHIGWLQGIGRFINVLLIIFFIPAMLGVKAVIYKHLTAPEDAPAAPVKEAPAAPAPAKEAPAPAAPTAPAPEAPAAPAPKAPASAPKAPKAPAKE